MSPSVVMFFSVVNTYTSDSLGASTTENHGISPFQYSSTEVLGVPPPISSIKSLKDVVIQPFGTQPNSVSSNSAGNSARISAGSGLKSALLRTFLTQFGARLQRFRDWVSRIQRVINHRVEIHKPGFEQGLGHLFQGLVNFIIQVNSIC